MLSLESVLDLRRRKAIEGTRKIGNSGMGEVRVRKDIAFASRKPQIVAKLEVS